MQLRLSGLGSTGISPREEATPPHPPLCRLPPPPPPSYTCPSQTPPSTSSVNVPFLSAVISSLTAENLAAILIQNSALGPSTIIGAPSYLQQLGAVPSLPLPSYLPTTSALPSSSASSCYGTGTYRWAVAVYYNILLHALAVGKWHNCIP